MRCNQNDGTLLRDYIMASSRDESAGARSEIYKKKSVLPASRFRLGVKKVRRLSANAFPSRRPVFATILKISPSICPLGLMRRYQHLPH